MSKIIIPWSEAKNLINEADVLLFRSGGFPSIGYFIVSYTGGFHSHVGLAHWDSNELYCVEQREFKGGRSVSLEGQVKQNPEQIDIYRVSKHIYAPHLFKNCEGETSIKWDKHSFGSARANEVTSIALGLTGSGYGWKNIWEIFKCYAPGFRLLRKPKDDDEISRAFVCSTLVTYSYRQVYGDLCPNLSDSRTSPADIAQSAMLHYLFTIGS